MRHVDFTICRTSCLLSWSWSLYTQANGTLHLFTRSTRACPRAAGSGWRESEELGPSPDEEPATRSFGSSQGVFFRSSLYLGLESRCMEFHCCRKLTWCAASFSGTEVQARRQLPWRALGKSLSRLWTSYPLGSSWSLEPENKFERGTVEEVFPTRVTPRKSPRSLFTLLTALTNMRSWRMLVSSSKMAAILIGLGTKSPPGNASTRQKRQIEQIIADSRILQPKQKFIWIALKRSFAVKWQLKRHIFTENRKGKGHNCRETLDNRQITPRNP